MHIITEITPLFLQYKSEKVPEQAIAIMWKIGEILNRYIISTGLKPHTLYRDLYGKSETSINIQQKSYISREFQGRCYRVYKMFKTVEEIRLNLQGLKSISIFREAMPFFDNEKYKIDREQLYKILIDKNKSAAAILNEVKQLQSSLIGKKNPRTQKLSEMGDETNSFKEFYQYVLSFIKMKNFLDASSLFAKETGLNEKQVKILAKNTEQLVLSNVQHSSLNLVSSVQLVQKYIETLEELLSPKNIKKLRRFRRLVNNRYVLLLTDMLTALTDEDGYLSLVRKLNK